MAPETNILIYVLILAGIIVLFIALREVILWYYKINKQILILQTMLALMVKQYQQNGGILSGQENMDIIKAMKK